MLCNHYKLLVVIYLWFELLMKLPYFFVLRLAFFSNILAYGYIFDFLSLFPQKQFPEVETFLWAKCCLSYLLPPLSRLHNKNKGFKHFYNGTKSIFIYVMLVFGCLCVCLCVCVSVWFVCVCLCICVVVCVCVCACM